MGANASAVLWRCSESRRSITPFAVARSPSNGPISVQDTMKLYVIDRKQVDMTRDKYLVVRMLLLLNLGKVQIGINNYTPGPDAGHPTSTIIDGVSLQCTEIASYCSCSRRRQRSPSRPKDAGRSSATPQSDPSVSETAIRM